MAAPELCHLFLFVEPDAPEARALNDLGLRESCRRAHPGQGTANICYCFDNAFLELLWVTDREEITSPAIRRTGLAERSDWRANGANPFGIAVRTETTPPFSTWPYRPPYVPEGHAIPVALSSDETTQPLIFVSPGNARPDRWTDGRAGERQIRARLSEIIDLELFLGIGVPVSPDLEALVETGLVTLGGGSSEPKAILTISQSDSGPARRLELPSMRWL